ncbi:MAG: hypothetical protein mread185_000333 [Mycoplasmataceae bacterium]|nr:MAG: hypothetical protein mread185_000235 [Mycoplasmataceae bacterium]WNE40876.1 MAG: hypothetical protein mread185_000333 [Mycoplasmataceae bacterium]
MKNRNNTKIKKEIKIMNILDTESNNEIKRESKCDKCQRLFYRKLSNNKGERKLTKVNEVNYWLKEGKNWGDFEILCRGCLADFFEKYRGEFTELINPKRQKLYYQYRYLGLISKESELYKRSL